MPLPSPFQRKPTLEEAQEEDSRLDIELSIAQKRAALKKLKGAGLSPRSFGSWKAILKWLKE